MLHRPNLIVKIFFISFLLSLFLRLPLSTYMVNKDEYKLRT